MKMTREAYDKLAKKMIAYYRNTDPFDKKGLITDTLRLSDPKRLYRVLCYCSYLGMNNHFAGGFLTKDILRITGWKMPEKATDQQITQDEIMSQKIEQKCQKYISQELREELIKKQGLILPVEWRMFYVQYVPADIFTSEELIFMKQNPCWLLPLKND